MAALVHGTTLANHATPVRIPTPSEIARIEIAHRPTSVSTRERRSLARLHAIAGTTHLVIDDPHARASLAREIAAAGIVPRRVRRAEIPSYDARWSFVFVRTHGGNVEIACDAFGKRGAVDAFPIRIRRLAPVLERLARAHPRLDPTRRGG